MGECCNNTSSCESLISPFHQPTIILSPNKLMQLLIISPTCGRGRNNNWVYAHWYEEGSWSGSSKGIEPDGSKLDVQGQTRFWVDDDLKIKEIVITRTFSRWEESLLKRGWQKSRSLRESEYRVAEIQMNSYPKNYGKLKICNGKVAIEVKTFIWLHLSLARGINNAGDDCLQLSNSWKL